MPQFTLMPHTLLANRLYPDTTITPTPQRSGKISLLTGFSNTLSPKKLLSQPNPLATPKANIKGLPLSCTAQPNQSNGETPFAHFTHRLQLDLPGSTIEQLQNTPEDKQAVATLWQTTFIDQEPLAKCLHEQDPVRFEQAMQIFCSAAVDDIAKENLSAVVRDQQGNIVACLLAVSYQQESFPDIPELAPLQPIFSILDTLANKFAAWKAMQQAQGNTVGPTLHLLIAATKPNLPSSKVAKTLLDAVSSNGRNYGFHDMVAEATSGSKFLLRTRGFQAIDQVTYQNHPIFQQVKSKAKEAALMYRKIDQETNP